MTMTSTLHHAKAGTTLVELIVTLAVISVLASVATLAIRRVAPPVDDLSSAIEHARTSAAERGAAVHVSRVEKARPVEFVAYPDGRVVIDTGYGVHPLTGRAASVHR